MRKWMYDSIYASWLRMLLINVLFYPFHFIILIMNRIFFLVLYDMIMTCHLLQNIFGNLRVFLEKFSGYWNVLFSGDNVTTEICYSNFCIFRRFKLVILERLKYPIFGKLQYFSFREIDQCHFREIEISHFWQITILEFLGDCNVLFLGDWNVPFSGDWNVSCLGDGSVPFSRDWIVLFSGD